MMITRPAADPPAMGPMMFWLLDFEADKVAVDDGGILVVLMRVDEVEEVVGSRELNEDVVEGVIGTSSSSYLQGS